MAEYDTGVEESNNIAVCELPESEFEDLCNHDVFKKLNEECNLMIDDYESEVIDRKALDKANKFLLDDEFFKNTSVFKNAFESACNEGVALALDF